LVVIATKTGGTPEIVKHNVTGLLFMPNDYQELLKLITIIYYNRDLGDRIGKNALELVRNTYSIKRMVNEFEQYLMGKQKINAR